MSSNRFNPNSAATATNPEPDAAGGMAPARRAFIAGSAAAVALTAIPFSADASTSASPTPAKEQTMTPTPTAADLLRRSLDTFLAKDMKGWIALCAEDVVAEFPFAPPGSPARIEGREALDAYLRNYPDAIDIRSLPTLRTYNTDDPNVAIAEWSASGVVIGNGNPYEMSYATFVTFRDGLIVNYREYWNPQAFLKAMGGSGF
ncbi:MAG: nuclear transport factor 2 family protein [Brevundimonas sp.]